MASLAPIDEFNDRVPGGIDGADTARAQGNLDDASALIRAEAGSAVADGWDAGTVPDVVKTICMSAAKRAFLNPDGIRGMSIDGNSAQFSTASPDVYLTKAEKSAVRRAAGRSGLWVQSTTRSEKTLEDDGTTTIGGLDTPNVQDTDEIIDAGDLSDFFP